MFWTCSKKKAGVAAGTCWKQVWLHRIEFLTWMHEPSAWREHDETPLPRQKIQIFGITLLGNYYSQWVGPHFIQLFEVSMQSCGIMWDHVFLCNWIPLYIGWPNQKLEWKKVKNSYPNGCYMQNIHLLYTCIVSIVNMTWHDAIIWQQSQIPTASPMQHTSSFSVFSPERCQIIHSSNCTCNFQIVKRTQSPLLLVKIRSFCQRNSW